MTTTEVVRPPDDTNELGRALDLAWLAELDGLRARARRLAVTPGLSAADLARAHAGRYVLGLEMTP
jgi:hypothetical protein